MQQKAFMEVSNMILSGSLLLSESSPMTQAGLWVFRLISRTWVSRSESRLHPAPITRVGGRPLCLQATWVMMSTGIGQEGEQGWWHVERLMSRVVRSFSLAPTWLWGNDHHCIRAETCQIRDDSSVQVDICLNHADIRLLAAPCVGGHHDDAGARRGWQI